MLMTSSEQQKHLLIQIQFFFQSKAVLVLNVSATFEYDQIKDEEAEPILIQGSYGSGKTWKTWKTWKKGLF